MRLLLLLSLILVAACGDSQQDGNGAGGSGGPGTGGSPEVAGGGAGGGSPIVTSMTIGSRGGTLTTLDGVVLVIPAGALTSDTTISVTQVTDDVPGEVVSGVFELQPDGTEFALPVELTIPYDAALLGDSPPDELAIASLAEAGWTGTGWTLIDGARAEATTYITHFSPWAVVLAPPGGCSVNYGCIKQCAAVDVPDLCCDGARNTCRFSLTGSFLGYAACYATCVGGPQRTNFGNSVCMADCCTAEGWTVKSQGVCYAADGSQAEAEAVIDCCGGCFGFPDASTLCDSGGNPCAWLENNTPNMGENCDGNPMNGGIISAELFTGLSSVSGQLWGGPQLIQVNGGSLNASTINVQLGCASAVPDSGTMSGTWNGSSYTGNWTFGMSNGTFSVAPAWPQD